MAALTADQVTLVYYDGACGRTALYALKNVDAADTADVASHFKVVKRAGIVSDSGTTIAAVSAITGTVLTIPTGPADDGVWLLVVGVAA
jgi:uncharacterized membrane protein